MSTSPARPPRREHRVSLTVRAAMLLAVVAVSAVAGWVSYWHCVQLVESHGEDQLVARIMPATVDGLVLAASLVLLDCARSGRDAPRLAYLLLGVGVLATLAANVSHGLAYGITGAVISGWPAAALVGTGELALMLVRQPATPAPADAPADAPRVAPVTHPVTHPVSPPPTPRPAADALAAARTMLASHPDLSGRELARRLGVSARTGQRLRLQLTR